MPRPPILLLAGVLAAIALPGCGGGDTKTGDAKVGGSLGTALSYLPKRPVLVVVVPTQLDRGPLKELDRLAAGSGPWNRFKRNLKRQIEKDLDFETELRPQLGNPSVYAMGRGGDNDESSSLQVKDPKRLRQLLQRSIRRGDEARLPSYKGALMTKDVSNSDHDMAYTAIYQDVLLSADRPRQLRRAIDRHRGSDNLARAKSLGAKVASLDANSVVRVAGDAGKLISSSRDPDLRLVRKVPWVRAFGEFTATARVANRVVAIEGKLGTDRRHLAEEDLPLATGSEAARLHRERGFVVLGIRNPGTLLTFFERALHAASPKQFRVFNSALNKVRRRSNVSLETDLVGKFLNTSSAIGDTVTYQADLEPGSGPAVAEAISRSQRFTEKFVQRFVPGRTLIEAGHGVHRAWTVKRNGSIVGRYAVRGDKLVGRYAVPGHALVGSAGRPVLQPPTVARPVAWAKGALFVGIDLAQYARVARVLGIQTRLLRKDRSGFRTLQGLGRVELALEVEQDALFAKGRITLPKGH
jgi:hypothetical protein